MNKKRDLIVFLFSNIASKFFLGLSGILLARFLTKEDFGLFRTITTFVGLIGIFVNFGLSDFLLLEASKNKITELKRKTVENYLLLYTIFFPISLVSYFCIYSKGLFVMFIFYLKLLLDWFSNTIMRIFQARNEFKIISFLIFVNAILLFLPVVYLYISKSGLEKYVIALLFASFISCFIYIFIYSQKESIKNLISLPRMDKKILMSSFPFFVSGLMAYVYMQSDILMLSFMKGTVEVGRYAVATTLIFAAYLLPTVLYNSFLPKLAAVFGERKELNYFYNQFLILTLVLTLPPAVLLFVFSEEILKFIYTYKYVDSKYILKILAIVFLFHSLCFVFGAVITASGNQSLRSKTQILAAITNILLNVIFIPLYGAEGAAFTTAMTEVIIFSLYWYFSRKLTYEEIYK